MGYNNRKISVQLSTLMKKQDIYYNILSTEEYPSYSVTIRTLGKAGDKYAATLESIRKQSLQPEEVVIVIPDGYDLPKDRLGFERFVRCKKGMVNQRVVGINEMSSDFTLALDDDVEFNADFVKSLFDIQINNSADFVSPKITEPNNSMTTSKPVSTQQSSSARGRYFINTQCVTIRYGHPLYKHN